MQHRALMFGLLGAVFIYGALQPTVHLFASILAITSMVGFIFPVGFDNPESKLHKVYPNYLKILAFSVRIKGFRQGELEKAWLFHVDTI